MPHEDWVCNPTYRLTRLPSKNRKTRRFDSAFLISIVLVLRLLQDQEQEHDQDHGVKAMDLDARACTTAAAKPFGDGNTGGVEFLSSSTARHWFLCGS
jgi:hypothetical protein